MTSFPTLSPRTTNKPGVLVTVSGGVAETTFDEAIELVTVDFDEVRAVEGEARSELIEEYLEALLRLPRGGPVGQAAQLVREQLLEFTA